MGGAVPVRRFLEIRLRWVQIFGPFVVFASFLWMFVLASFAISVCVATGPTATWTLRVLIAFMGSTLITGVGFSLVHWYAVIPMIAVSFLGLRWAARSN
jgi:hypothetical protein